MKKYLMSAAVVALLIGTTSQANAQKGLNVSVKLTPQFSSLQNADDKDNKAIDKETTFRTNFGAGVGYNFTDNVGVGIDVLYSLQGQKMNVILLGDVDQKLGYIKVPLYLSYSSDVSNAIGLYGKIGPQLSFLSKSEVTTNGKNSIENKDKYQSTTFGMMANVGAQFRLIDNLSLQTGIYFDTDFTNAEDEDYIFYTPNRANTYNMNVGLQIGLKYQF